MIPPRGARSAATTPVRAARARNSSTATDVLDKGAHALMAENTEEMTRRLSALSDERAQLEAAVEDMIADMAGVPPDQRATSAWASDGASTQRYLTLTDRLAEVEAEMIELGRAIGSADTPPSSRH